MHRKRGEKEREIDMHRKRGEKERDRERDK